MRVYVVGAAGGTPVLLGRGFRPRWSPSGARIAFETNPEDFDGPAQAVFLARPQGGPVLTFAGGRTPAWSRTGLLAFVRGATVFVVREDGTRPRSLGPGLNPAWSPDGGQLAVGNPRCGPMQGIWSIRIRDGMRRRLTDGCWIRGTGVGDRIVGTPRRDVIRGDGGDDRIDGGGGPDQVEGGAGVDRLAGGAGNDELLARDGWRDQVDCGRGRDVAEVDPIDLVARSCEVVHRRPA